MSAQGWFVVGALAAALTLAASGGGSSDTSETATAVTDPTATGASETPTRVPSLAGSALTPRRTPTPLIPGGRIRELTWGDPVPIEGFAAIIDVGCFGCDIPLERLVRVYRDPAGELRQDVLFERNPYGTNPRYISGIAISKDGANLAVTVCTTGYCGGVADASADAATTLHTSSDGGMTYSVEELAGASAARSYGADGLLLWNQDSNGVFSYEWHDSDEPLAGPDQASRFPLVTAGAGTEF